ncbi:MAG: TetR/AcrR family transcriptional regulator [Pseudonocardiales bacterium]|nr:TetR/AcrR family transcriptional regulator [Actinomycetota bacterium]
MPYRRTPGIQARLDTQRVAIVQAAGDLLTVHGYSGCSVAAVAGTAGVAAGTVYRHFDGKAELVSEVFRAVAGREVDAVQAAVAGTSGALAQIAAVIETFAGRALKAPRLAYTLLAEPVDPAVDRLRLEFRIAFRDVIVQVVAAGVRCGDLPPQNAAVAGAALVGAIGEALVGPLGAASPDPDTVAALITFAARAIGATDATHA